MKKLSLSIEKLGGILRTCWIWTDGHGNYIYDVWLNCIDRIIYIEVCNTMHYLPQWSDRGFVNGILIRKMPTYYKFIPRRIVIQNIKVPKGQKYSLK